MTASGDPDFLSALICDQVAAPDGSEDDREETVMRTNPYHHEICPRFRGPGAATIVSCSAAQVDACIAHASTASSSFVSATSAAGGGAAAASSSAARRRLPAAFRPSALSSAWATATFERRHEVLKECAAAIDAMQTEVALMDVVETGIPLPVEHQIVEGLAPVALRVMDQAMADVFCAADKNGGDAAAPAAAAAAAEEETHRNNDTVHHVAVANRFGGLIVGRRKPLSPAVIIAPFNVPLGTILPKLFVALLAGCHVIVKPSPVAAKSMTRVVIKMHEIIHGTHGFSRVLSLVHGGPAVGEQLITDARTAAVQFTGAPATAAIIAGACKLKPLLAECGGSNSALILRSCDRSAMTAAVRYIAMGMLTLNGQWCMSPSRVLVHASRKDEFLRKLRRYLAARVRLFVSEADMTGVAVVGNNSNDDNSNQQNGSNNNGNDAAAGREVSSFSFEEENAQQQVFLEIGPLANRHAADSVRAAMSRVVTESNAQGGEEGEGEERSGAVIEPLLDLLPAWRAHWEQQHQQQERQEQEQEQQRATSGAAECMCGTIPSALPSTYVAPSVILDADPQVCARHEFFAPVIALNTFGRADDAGGDRDDEGVEEAIWMSNLASGQLCCSVFTSEVARDRERVALRLRSGMVFLNSMNFAFECADESADVAADFWGSAGAGSDGSGAAVARFFSRVTLAGVVGDGNHEGHHDDE